MSRIPLGSRFLCMMVTAVVMVLASGQSARPQETDPDCAALRDRWEQVFHELKLKTDDFEATRRIPLDRIVQRRLVETGTGKTIARQVSEAIQAKEGILDAKRKECVNLMNLENQAFNELERCGQERKGLKKKDTFQQLASKRRALIQRVQTTIAEVREVEGKDTYAQYGDLWRAQPDAYNRGADNYWQRMNQGYWGR